MEWICFRQRPEQMVPHLDGLVGYPEWSNSATDGSLEGGFGYWFQEVLTDERTCTSPDEISK